MSNKKSDLCITMIGTGYVGLTTGTCTAELGAKAGLKHKVICIDKDAEKINKLKLGQIPIYEPGLEILVQQNLERKCLEFDTHLKNAVLQSEVIFIAVGTPTCLNTNQTDLSYLSAALKELAPLLNESDYKVIVIKSTVPVGTGRYAAKMLRTLNPKAKFDMVSNPEFLREGSAVIDFMQPDRMIIGLESDSVREMMNRIYQPLIDQQIPVLYTDIESSELIKYTANCFLATKIAFINEVASLCEKTGANIELVTQGLGLDKRIGLQYLQPGPGFGGSCFPKDTLALMHAARTLGAPLTIVEAVVHSNEDRKNKMVDKIVEACGGSVQGKTLGILGLAFKANTDDIRESSAIVIVNALQKMGATLRVYDPAAMQTSASVLPDVIFASDPYDAMSTADAVVIVTEWDEFKGLDFRSQIKQPIIIDLRNLYEVEQMKQLGIPYSSIGRPEKTTSKAQVKIHPEILEDY